MITKHQFKKEIKRVQKILGLNDWIFTYSLEEKPWFMWQMTTADYKRFEAHFTFDSRFMEEQIDTIRLVLMHEFCHIFTISSLRYFSEDEHMQQILWMVMHQEMVTRMEIINEQMTVRLERILTKLTKTI